jgi:hypothetical protein
MRHLPEIRCCSLHPAALEFGLPCYILIAAFEPLGLSRYGVASEHFDGSSMARRMMRS